MAPAVGVEQLGVAGRAEPGVLDVRGIHAGAREQGLVRGPEIEAGVTELVGRSTQASPSQSLSVFSSSGSNVRPTTPSGPRTSRVAFQSPPHRGATCDRVFPAQDPVICASIDTRSVRNLFICASPPSICEIAPITRYRRNNSGTRRRRSGRAPGWAAATLAVRPSAASPPGPGAPRPGPPRSGPAPPRASPAPGR